MRYSSFRASGFRCFKEIEVNELSRINLISGKNNVGKTTLLEAIFVHSGVSNPNLLMTVDALRGLTPMKVELGAWASTPWDFAFKNFDTDKRIELSGVFEPGHQRSLRIRVVRRPEDLNDIWSRVSLAPVASGDKEMSAPTSTESVQVLEFEYKDTKGDSGQKYMVVDSSGPRVEIASPPPYPGYIQGARGKTNPAELAGRFSKLEIKKRKSDLLKALQIIEPRLRDVTLVSSGPGPLLYADLEGFEKLIPLNLMGEGMSRIVDLVLAIGTNPNGVVMWDEMENGLHYSILPDLWTVVDDLTTKHNVQLFTTTHSYECIFSAHKVFSGAEASSFALYRLDRTADNVRAVRYDRELLDAAAESRFEVR